MTTSDWVLIGSSLFLGFAALFVPFMSEWIKGRLFAPKLEVTYSHAPPTSLRTFWRSRVDLDLDLGEPVYFFRINIKNVGKSQARQVEALVEELWYFDASQKPHKLPRFSPVKLRYDERRTMFVDINPERSVFWNIGHISSRERQNREEKRNFIDVPGDHSTELRFMMELIEYPYSQPNCLVSGKYGLTIAVYSENSQPTKLHLVIDWSGKWHDDEETMFREIVISSVSKFG